MASACGVLRARYERRLVVTPCAGKTVGVSHARRCRSCVVRYRGEGEVDAVVSATACVHEVGKKIRPRLPPRRARDKRDCDAEMPPSEEVAMVEEKRPTRADALRALRVQVGGARVGFEDALTYPLRGGCSRPQSIA